MANTISLPKRMWKPNWQCKLTITIAGYPQPASKREDSYLNTYSLDVNSIAFKNEHVVME